VHGRRSGGQIDLKSSAIGVISFMLCTRLYSVCAPLNKNTAGLNAEV
jgi:hypothetical protein